MIEEELRKYVGGKYSSRELKIAINFYKRGLTDKKPTADEMLRALRMEYEKGRADAFAEMQKEWSEDDEKWIESIYTELSHEQQMEAEAFFPELQESEDERIRKEIIATIHLYYGEPLEDEAKEMIAWLEKQEGKHITKPQSRWWPSEKQMQMLHRAIEVKAPGVVRDGLESLYNDLKNL